MIENWNKMVGKGDTVYILGDFAWKNHNHYIMALNGRKIITLGSHDKMNRDSLKNFSEVHEFGCKKRIFEQDVSMSHYALRTWDGSFRGTAWSLFGHSHHRLPEFNNMMSFDVGVDGFGYSIVPWEVIVEKMNQKINWAKENAKKIVDGENKADGQYDMDPEKRVIESRKRNKEIVRKMGYPIIEEMWPET